MPDVGLLSSTEPLPKNARVIIKYSIEVEGLPVYNETYCVDTVADELKKDGVELIPAMPWQKSQMPATGFRIGKLSREREEDLAFGYRNAKEVSRLEIGQTVVEKDGTVLAVEGFEGTDRCLQRGGERVTK